MTRMTESRRGYILARPVHEATSRLAAGTFYHGRFRGFAAEAHAHADTAQLLLPLGGRMHLVANGEDHLLGPEWGALVMPGVEHAFTHLDGELDFLSVEMPTSALAALGEVLTLPVPTSGVRVVREMRLLLQGQQLATELDAPQVGFERLLHTGLEQLVVYFLRALQAAPAVPLAQEPRVLRAVDRILRDFADPLSVEELAAEQAMSPRHFERCFKQAVGRSPKRFMIEVRIGAAQDMLVHSERAIAEIAMDVGFSQPSHFAETFQKLTGQTPRAYRQGKKRSPI